ncbi:MAG: hypothetical protein H0W88_09740 [Parachlamydiaceae bacterium]|nr:hypothetical protein [Parachlamydiaceae bacterium]
MEFVHFRKEIEFNAVFDSINQINDLNQVNFERVGKRYKPIKSGNLNFIVIIYRWFQNFFSNRREQVILNIFAFIRENSEISQKKVTDIESFGNRIIKSQIKTRDQKRVQSVFNNLLISLKAINADLNKSGSNLQPQLQDLEQREKTLEQSDFKATEKADIMLAEAEVECQEIEQTADQLIALAKSKSEAAAKEELIELQNQKRALEIKFEMEKMRKENEIFQISDASVVTKAPELDLDIPCKGGAVVVASLETLQREISYFKTADKVTKNVKKEDQAKGLDEDEVDEERSTYRLNIDENHLFSERAIRTLTLFADNNVFFKDQLMMLVNSTIKQLTETQKELEIHLKNFGKIEGVGPQHNLKPRQDAYSLILRDAYKNALQLINKFRSQDHSSKNLLKLIEEFSAAKASIVKVSTGKNLLLNDYNKLLQTNKITPEIHSLLTKELSQISEIDTLELVINNFNVKADKVFNAGANDDFLKKFPVQELWELDSIANYFNYADLKEVCGRWWKGSEFTPLQLIDMMTIIPYDKNNVHCKALCSYIANIDLMNSPMFMKMPTPYLMHVINSDDFSVSEEALYTRLKIRFQMMAKSNGVTVQQEMNEKVGEMRLIDCVRFERMKPDIFKGICKELSEDDQKVWTAHFNKTKTRALRSLRVALDFVVKEVDALNTEVKWRIPVNDQKVKELLALTDSNAYYSPRGESESYEFTLNIGRKTSDDRIAITLLVSASCRAKLQIGNLSYDTNDAMLKAQKLVEEEMTDTHKEINFYFTPAQLNAHAIGGYINVNCDMQLILA